MAKDTQVSITLSAADIKTLQAIPETYDKSGVLEHILTQYKLVDFKNCKCGANLSAQWGVWRTYHSKTGGTSSRIDGHIELNTFVPDESNLHIKPEHYELRKGSDVCSLCGANVTYND